MKFIFPKYKYSELLLIKFDKDLLNKIHKIADLEVVLPSDAIVSLLEAAVNAYFELDEAKIPEKKVYKHNITPEAAHSRQVEGWKTRRVNEKRTKEEKGLFEQYCQNANCKYEGRVTSKLSFKARNGFVFCSEPCFRDFERAGLGEDGNQDAFSYTTPSPILIA